MLGRDTDTGLGYRLQTTTLNLQQIQRTLEDQHEEQNQNAQLIKDKLRLAEDLHAKTQQSKELIDVIRKLGSLFEARLADDERDYGVQFVHEMYDKIKNIMYPDDPEAFGRLMKATNGWGQS